MDSVFLDGRGRACASGAACVGGRWNGGRMEGADAASLAGHRGRVRGWGCGRCAGARRTGDASRGEWHRDCMRFG